MAEQRFPNLHVLKHPLVQHKLTELRDKSCSKKDFNELVREISLLLVYEATQDLALTTRSVDTPLTTFEAPVLAGKKPVIVPILRAGIGMVDAFLTLMPLARVGHVGMFRDEKTLEPQTYYFKLPPNSENRPIFVCDPMLATGGSAVAALKKLKEAGLTNITFVCLVAAPEGVQHFFEAFPDVPMYTASLDQGLNDQSYIVPGLGDAGDRLFGTK